MVDFEAEEELEFVGIFSDGAKIPPFPEIVDEEMHIRSSLFYCCEYVRRDEEMPATLNFLMTCWENLEACDD